MLARYQITDHEQLCRRIQLFQDAALQFAIFISAQSERVCLIPTFGPAFTEMLQWPEVEFIGTYDEHAQQPDIVADVNADAYLMPAERRDKVHYHRYRNGMVKAYKFRFTRRRK